MKNRTLVLILIGFYWVLGACSMKGGIKEKNPLKNTINSVPIVANSSFTVVPPHVADGSTVTLVMVLRNASFKPVAGVQLNLSVDGFGSQVISPCGLTDINGVASCTFRVLEAGVRLISLGGVLVWTQNVTFTNGIPVRVGIVSGGKMETDVGATGWRVYSTIGVPYNNPNQAGQGSAVAEGTNALGTWKVTGSVLAPMVAGP